MFVFSSWVNKVKDACPDDLKKDTLGLALHKCAREGNKQAATMLNDNCPENFKGRVFSLGLFSCALEGDQKALDIVIDTCSKGSAEQKMYNGALVYCAREGNQLIFDMVKDACLHNMKKKMFVQALKNCALEYDLEAINMVNTGCPSDLKEEMFVQALCYCALEQDHLAIQMINEALSELHLLKEDILSAAIFNCVFKDDQQAVEMIINYCLIDSEEDILNKNDLEIEVLADVLAQYAFLNEPEKFKMLFKILKDLCQENQREKILLKALYKSFDKKNNERGKRNKAHAIMGNHQHRIRSFVIEENANEIAIKMISEASEDLVALFSGVLSIKSTLKDIEAVQLLTDTCPNLEDTKEEVFLSALKSCCFFNREEEIGILIHACSEDLKKCIFLNALKYYALHGIGEMYNKPFETLVNSCPEDIKPYIFTQALEDIQAYMYNLVLDDVKKYMFTKKKSPDEIEKNIFDQALNDSKINMHPKAFDIKWNQKALDMISEAHRGYLEKNNFLRAVEAMDQEAVDLAIKNCPEDLKQQMFVQVLRDAALKKDEKAVEMIVRSLPDLDFELRKNVFTKVRIDPGIKMDCEAYDMIERTYRKYPIKNIFFKLLQEKNQEAVGKLLTGCWPNLKKKMFPEALQKYALKKDKEVVSLIIETCPQELKEHMFTKALEDSDLKKDQEAVDTIKETNAYRQYCISKMAANPTNNNSKRGEEQKSKHSNRKTTKKAPTLQH